MSQVLVEVKECEKCRTPIRTHFMGDRETSYDIASGDEHECWDIPDDAEVLLLNDDVAMGGCCEDGH